ncbi:Uncharacterised protein [Streptococcus pneumoniae]|nr:Uncharacterised protein [Streptococcus pneumoniae]
MTRFFLTVDFFFFVAVATVSHLFKVINFIKCKPFFEPCQDLATINRRKVLYLKPQSSFDIHRRLTRETSYSQEIIAPQTLYQIYWLSPFLLLPYP